MFSESSKGNNFCMSPLTNMHIRKWQRHLTIPLETFADQDVLQVILDNQEKESAERKAVEAKRAAVRAVEQAAKAEVAKTKAAAKAAKIKPAAEKDADGDKGHGEKEDEEENNEQESDEGTEVGDNEDLSDEEPSHVHQGVTCDGCKVSVAISAARLNMNEFRLQTDDSIVGNRFKCTICANLDLCESCHKAGIHDKHPMLKIEDPADVRGAGDVVCAIGFIIKAPLLKSLSSQ
jgi:hypothetical protein